MSTSRLQYKNLYCLIVEQILAFVSTTNLVREAKLICLRKFQTNYITCFTLQVILIWIDKSILS